MNTHTHTPTFTKQPHNIYLSVPLTDIGVVSKVLLLQKILQKISLYLNRSTYLSIYTYFYTCTKELFITFSHHFSSFFIK